MGCIQSKKADGEKPADAVVAAGATEEKKTETPAAAPAAEKK
eukprot:CAMPEP_0171503054 /NCGR_PEP_ID=MMETSP0958-20121227/10618_1 /TAXON_ID=87120 /ORGANISM="Aurantiochytrium limacinum, Strain ATCCMYA-1381" /LENGTH=41 /DNA_ID= /DNA_START= /DNA_END= /DNA_ORIENTATION=